MHYACSSLDQLIVIANTSPHTLSQACKLADCLHHLSIQDSELPTALQHHTRVAHTLWQDHSEWAEQTEEGTAVKDALHTKYGASEAAENIESNTAVRSGEDTERSVVKAGALSSLGSDWPALLVSFGKQGLLGEGCGPLLLEFGASNVQVRVSAALISQCLAFIRSSSALVRSTY